MLTKDSFPLTHLFLYYQTLKNTKNYLYTKFSIETNGASELTLKFLTKRVNFMWFKHPHLLVTVVPNLVYIRVYICNQCELLGLA